MAATSQSGTKTQRKGKTTHKAQPPAEKHQLIAETAYMLAQKRGFEIGHELEDWLQAEAQVEAQLTRKH